MGLIFDKIDAEVAAREGLIAAAGVGRLHLLPMRDRSLIEKRTRNIRAIRNDAAAKLGGLPSQTIQADPDGRGLRDFRIDFHRKGGAIDPRGRYSIFATATDLSSKKRYVVGNAEHERLRTNAAPTGRRTANVIGTDELGQPIYEIVEDVQAALLSHLTAQVVRHLKPVIVGSAEAKALGVVEWGSTIDTVTFDQDGVARRNSANSTWASLRAGVGTACAGNGVSASSGGCGTNSGTTTNRYDFIDRNPFEADLTAYSAPDSATLQLYIYAALSTMGDPTAHVCPSSAPVGTLAPSDYDIGNHTYTSKGSIALADITTGQHNGIGLTLDLLNFGGVSKFVAIEDSDLNDTAPTWTSGGNAWKVIFWRASPYTGTDQDPYLELTTAAPAASGGSMISPLNLISRLGR